MEAGGVWKRLTSMILLALGLVNTVSSCSCMPLHAQQHFCGANFAIRAVVYDQGLQPVNASTYKFSDRIQKYSLHHIKVFKTSPEYEKVKQKDILHTSSMDSMCGITLENKHKYFITGYVSDGKLRVGLCDWVESWATIPQRQRRLIMRGYNKHCRHCKVKTCFGCKEAKSHSRRGRCTWVYNSPTADCYNKFALCKCKGAPSRPSRCRWSYGRRSNGERENAFTACYKLAH